MTRSRRAAVVAIAILLTVASGCGVLMDRHDASIPEDVRAITDRLVAALHARDSAELETILAPDGWTEEQLEGLRQFALSLPPGAAYEVKRGAWVENAQLGSVVYETAVQLGIAGRHYYLGVLVRRDAEGLRVVGVQIQPAEFDLEEVNRFNVKGKPPPLLVLFLLALAIPAFVIWSLVDCWRRNPRRKWLWMAAILVCFPSLQMSWTIGAGSIVMRPLFLLGRGFMQNETFFPWALLGSGFSQAGRIEPMIVGIALPIGAIAWYVARRYVTPDSRTPAPPPPAEGAGDAPA